MQSLIMTGVFILGGIIGIYLLIFKILGLRYISSDEVGIVEKWWSKEDNGGEFMPLNNGAGFQPDLLSAGLHFKPGWMYKVHVKKMVTIAPGEIGYVFARSGKPLNEGQINGSIVECNEFQDARMFLENGGQKGPQRGILRPGTYSINLAQFVVITKDELHLIKIGDDNDSALVEEIKQRLLMENGFEPLVINDESKMAVVTTNEGDTLPQGETIAPIVGADSKNPETYHNNFQSPEIFLKAGGYRGKQHQVITEGTYFINRLFASIEIQNKTKIPMGFVGVVNSFVGKEGQDTSGKDYSHGELVERGCKGIWNTTLQPGKHSFNNDAGHIELVPTTNFILKWVSRETGEYNFDKGLSEITLITKDAFKPILPLSVVIHIDYRKAPKVILRFGDIKKLVEQTLDPMVSAYFKNVAQQKTLIELIQSRSEIQTKAKEEMKAKFDEFNIDLEDVLIGTPSPQPGDKDMEQILDQLTKRQVAREQIATYESEMEASKKEKELKEVQAKALQQSALTESAIKIEIADNEGKAEAKKAEQESKKMKIISEAEKIRKQNKIDADTYEIKQKAEANKEKADADAYALITMAKAEAEKINEISKAEAGKIKEIGKAEADALKAKVSAYGNPKLQVTETIAKEIAQSIGNSGQPLVPNNYINMGQGSNGIPNAMDMASILLADRLCGNGLFDTADKDVINTPTVELTDDVVKSKSVTTTNVDNVDTESAETIETETTTGVNVVEFDNTTNITNEDN